LLRANVFSLVLHQKERDKTLQAIRDTTIEMVGSELYTAHYIISPLILPQEGQQDQLDQGFNHVSRRWATPTHTSA
jgi:hypothetical protein